MHYLDYINLDYEPSESDVICKYYVEPADTSIKIAAGGIAAESSIGTWTKVLTEKNYVKKLAAKVYSINGRKISIAYPVEIFEKGNMANILSSVAGNIYGLKLIKNLRLLDMYFPKELAESFQGPNFGIEGIRETLKIWDRPLIGTIIKPKIGLNSKDHANIAYKAWIGGCDLVKDDENLADQPFNRFKDRLTLTLEARDKAEEETGMIKAYIPNISAETEKMLERMDMIKSQGGRYLMIDIITCGFSALQTVRKHSGRLIIHAHRAGHAAFTKNRKHGVKMKVICKISRLIGVDQLHVGTAVGKMSEDKMEVLENIKALKGKLYNFKPVLPVASGGLHAGLIPPLMEIFGKDVIIQAGGGIHGHKMGIEAGAKSMKQAVEASLKDIPLHEYAKTHLELKIVLENLKMNSWENLTLQS
ncbi:MAG: type III ribulose-bisphosphate carboxylase [Candidatus Methanomethylicota archaeon]|nr:MAG: type III ribulose-bisphosphate carboxylase [Candidatus Verstraetearchaeota archaeon]